MRADVICGARGRATRRVGRAGHAQQKRTLRCTIEPRISRTRLQVTLAPPSRRCHAPSSRRAGRACPPCAGARHAVQGGRRPRASRCAARARRLRAVRRCHGHRQGRPGCVCAAAAPAHVSRAPRGSGDHVPARLLRHGEALPRRLRARLLRAHRVHARHGPLDRAARPAAPAAGRCVRKRSPRGDLSAVTLG